MTAMEDNIDSVRKMEITLSHFHDALLKEVNSLNEETLLQLWEKIRTITLTYEVHKTLIPIMLNLAVDDPKSISKTLFKAIRMWRKSYKQGFDQALVEELVKMLENIQDLTDVRATMSHTMLEQFEIEFSPNALITSIKNLSICFKNFNEYSSNHSRLGSLKEFLKLYIIILQRNKKFFCNSISNQSGDFQSIQEDLKCCFVFFINCLAGVEGKCGLLSLILTNCIGFSFYIFSNKDGKYSQLLLKMLIFAQSGIPFDHLPILCGIVISSEEVGSLRNKSSTAMQILGGVFSCCKHDPCFNPERMYTTMKVAFDILKDSCYTEDASQHNAFKSMEMWWNDCLQLAKVQKIDIFTQFRPMVDGTMKLLYQYWDNHQASQSVNKILDSMLQIDDLTMREKDIGESFTWKTATKLLSEPIHERGKYRLLSVLIKKLGAERFLSMKSDFLLTLVPCLENNNLAPAASRCFIETTKSVYISHKAKANLYWEQHIWPALDAAITSSNEVISREVFRHWIKPVVQYCSDGLKDAVLLNRSYSQRLRIRAMKHLPASECQADYSTLFPELVLTSLTSLDDVIRVDAWSVICRGRAQDVPPSLEDMEIIKEHLLLDFNSDNPAFRQSLVQCLRELVERIRRFVASSIKSKEKISLMKAVGMNLKFVVWLKRTCLKYLVPAASFQRKVTALSILKLILNSFPCTKTSPSKRNANDKLKSGQDRQLIAEYDAELQVDRPLACQMLQAMEDEVPEIRQMAAEIILDKLVKKERVFCLKSMQSQSELLIGSVKQQRAELGALFAKCLFHVHYAEKADEVLIQLVRSYCRDIEENIQGLRENMLATARCNSPFGRMFALSLMIGTVRRHGKYLIDNIHFTDSIARASKAAAQCIEFFLKTVFSCRMTSGGYVGSADFEEISSRIQSMIIVDDSGKQDGGTMLSDDHEVVLACAWLSLRHGAALISEAESLLLEVPQRSDDAVVERNCRMFYSILSYCRHRGAIESAYESFVSYLCSLGATSTARPLQILDEAISTLESTGDVTEAIAGATITRRSAGNPLLVKAVLTAMVKTRHATDALFNCVTRLRAVADSGEKLTAASDKVDLPAVDAMYGLKSLLDDAYLGPKLNNATVLVPALETALRCIAAKVWVVCNAATHLLGAVSARMLGQKHIEDCSGGSSLTAGEFFGRFPGVLTLAREILSHDDSDPRVFPLLSILSRLRCGGKIFTCVEESEDFVDVRRRFFHLIGNKSHSIRTMSARCCLSFYSVDECLTKSLRCLKLLSAKNGNLLPSQNSLHGWLHFISNLMQSLTSEELDEDSTKSLLNEVANELLCCTWIADLSTNACPFTATIYINLTRNFTVVQDHKKFMCLRAAIESSLNKIWSLHSVGACSYIKAGVQRLMEMNVVDIGVEKFGVWESYFHEAQLDYMIELLTNGNPSEQDYVAAIKLLNRSDPAAYKRKLFHTARSKYTELVVTIFKRAPFDTIRTVLEKENALKMVAHIVEMSEDCRKYLHWRCHQINALSTLLSGRFWRCYLDEYRQRNRVVDHWVELAVSNPTFDGVAECVRLSAAESLTTVGEWFTNDCDQSSLPLPVAENYRIIVACISLLHDENLGIRQAACKMVHSFKYGQTDAGSMDNHIPHPKFALSMFLDFIKNSNFIRCNTTIKFLIEKFFILPHPQTSTRLFEEQSFNAYIENWSITEQLIPILTNAIKIVEISDSQLREWLKVAVEKVTILVELLDYRNNCCKESKENTQNNARVSEFSTCTLLFVELIMSFYKLSPASSPDPDMHDQLVQLLDTLSQNVDFWDASIFSRAIIENINKLTEC